MDQLTLGLDPLPKKTRKEVFFDEMNHVVPSAVLVALIAPFARSAHQALGGQAPRDATVQDEVARGHAPGQAPST